MITVMNLSLLEVELNPTGICSDIVHRTVMSLHPPPPPHRTVAGELFDLSLRPIA